MRINLTLGALALGLALSGAQPAGAQNSVAYQINPEHTGATEFRYGFNVPLERVWSRTFSGAHFLLYPTRISYPIIADGRVFVIVNALSPVRFMELVALSLENGKTLWSRALGKNAFRSASLAFDDGRLFVVTDLGGVLALDPQTGAKLWRTLPTEQRLFDPPPTARGGRLYFSGNGNGGTLFAIGQATGKIVWKQTVRGGFVSSPTVTNDSVFVGYGSQVYKFSRGGALLWHYDNGQTGNLGFTSPFYSGRLYTMPSAFNIWTFNADSGDHEITAPQRVARPPAFRNGVGYFAAVDRLVAQDVETKQTIWEFTGAQGPSLPPLVINGKVIVTSHGGDLYVLDAATGAQLQHILLPTEISFNLDHSEAEPRKGMAAGQGMLIVPAGDTLSAFKGAAP